jgi:hypothetical protein
MSLADFFTPIDQKKITPKDGFYTSQLGDRIDHHSVAFPDLEEKTDIAIIGVWKIVTLSIIPVALWARLRARKIIPAKRGRIHH